jgi:ferric-dicitrate binding protein FerR (iron transport regulator)
MRNTRLCDSGVAACGGLIALALVLLCVGSVRATAAEPVGTVAAVVGQAQVTRSGGSELRTLTVGAEVFEGDRIHIAADAKLRLSMVDGSVLSLGASTDLSLSRFHYAPEEAARNVLLEVPRGILRVLVELLVAQSTFEMQTHTAVASVRGTEWIAEAEPQATAIVALDGRVAVHNPQLESGGEVVLFPGDGTTVRAGQPPSAPAQWGAARKNSFIERTTVP